MKNITESLKTAITLQDFATKRGYELMMALGCRCNMYIRPYKILFEETGVSMSFAENTSHDCPDEESISLGVFELQKSEEEWAVYIENAKAQALAKKEAAQLVQKKNLRDWQEKEYERLRIELAKQS